MYSMHLYLYGAFFFVLNVSTELISRVTNVSSCPSDLKPWRQQESLKSCDEEKGFLYHCMKSSWDTFVEFCMVPVSINFYDGCPQVHIRDNFHIRYVECSISGHCPNEDVPTYPSYHLYKYDGCYKTDTNETLNSKERTSTSKYSFRYSTIIDPYTIVDYTTSKVKRTKEAGVTKVISLRNASTSLIFSQNKYVLGTTAVIFILLLCGSLIFSTYFIQKTMKHKKNKGFAKYHANLGVNRHEESVYNEIEDIHSEVSDIRSYEDPVSVNLQSDTVPTVPDQAVSG